MLYLRRNRYVELTEESMLELQLPRLESLQLYLLNDEVRSIEHRCLIGYTIHINPFILSLRYPRKQPLFALRLTRHS